LLLRALVARKAGPLSNYDRGRISDRGGGRRVEGCLRPACRA
jgi:hypothetical protein